MIRFTFFILVLAYSLQAFAQNDQITIDVLLNMQKHELAIQQNITYYNKSNTTLDTIYLLNWANSFKDRTTPLSKRLIEDYDKSLYFAKIKDRGETTINNITINQQNVEWIINKKTPDIVQLVLKDKLNPQDSIKISASYNVRIPLSSFTKYGRKDNTLNLRYWHLTPVVFNNSKWNTISNYNLDDYYMHPTDYSINLKLFEGLQLNTDLHIKKISRDAPYVSYELSGKNRVDIELNVSTINDFNRFKTDSIEVITNLPDTKLQDQVKVDVLNRQLDFIENILGKYPHKKLLVNKISYDKNPVYGLNQLPKFLNPFSGVFEWDIKMFKTLTKKFLENTLLVNRRNDYWLVDGIQNYMMILYVEKYYPEVKAMGNISKIWGVRSFNIAQLNFNGKYPFVYQFTTRKNIDQALTTRADSLSNFNRKIVNKYKAGLGLRYLDQFLQDSVVLKSIRQFYNQNKLKLSNSNSFKDFVSQKTTKDISWFFGDYIKTKKKIDYTIKKVKKLEDSVEITIKNKRNFKAPIALYGVKDKQTVFKKWLNGIDSTATIKVPKGNYTRLSLNYDFLYPEHNLRDNWKNLEGGILNRPVQFRFFKDIENPYYNQVFYNIFSAFNAYDGVLLGPFFYNEAIFKKKWLYRISPVYGFKSKSLNGTFSFVYESLPEKTSVYRYRAGIAGSKFHYDDNLSYRSLTPFLNISFKRKSLRDVGGSALTARYVIIDRERAPNTAPSESDSYNVFNLSYGYSKPDIIKDLSYSADFQLAQNFSKLSLVFRYRKLTDKHRQYDLRLFAGTFLHNDTNTDFFSFALDRPSDYLFNYNFLGRSNETGFFSQQIIITEGGFKSKFENRFANQWMLAANGSVGIWRFIEAYADAGFYKNRNQLTQFRYDSGIRLNFVHNFLELYFPIQSSLGFEPTQYNYASKIRFVLTLNPGRIYNFLKRGFF